MRLIYKIFFIFLFVLCTVSVTNAGSINPAVYRTMSTNSYRTNYNRQINQPMPYWRAQSSFSTRNRVYQDYNNYNRFMNNVNQYNYNKSNYRRMY